MWLLYGYVLLMLVFVVCFVVDESRLVFGVSCVLVVVCGLVLVVCCVLRCVWFCCLVFGVWCVLRVSG